VAVLKITVGYLYPDIMSTYGDRGNIETIVQRCQWRGIEAGVTELRLGDQLRPDELDLIVIGSGGESQQRLIADDLARVKGPAIREAVVAGRAAALAVGGGYELFGRFCRPGSGSDLPGAGLFDTWTLRSRAVLGGQYGTITEARADRAIGDLVVRWNGRLLVGFENHAGATFLGPTAQPLGQVIAGYGNSGNGHEGTALGSAVGTHLRGPCLPRNPALADFLIQAALRRRQPDAELDPLPDTMEHAARQAAIHRARQAARGRGGRLADTVLRKAGLATATSPAAAQRAGAHPAGAHPAGAHPAAATHPADVHPADVHPAATGMTAAGVTAAAGRRAGAHQ
jgi:CobQ-like glutamine amidotransferase family enzyme